MAFKLLGRCPSEDWQKNSYLLGEGERIVIQSNLAGGGGGKMYQERNSSHGTYINHFNKSLKSHQLQLGIAAIVIRAVIYKFLDLRMA